MLHFHRCHLVDLAGSERINQSGVVGDRLRESQHINKSLSALEQASLASTSLMCSCVAGLRCTSSSCEGRVHAHSISQFEADDASFGRAWSQGFLRKDPDDYAGELIVATKSPCLAPIVGLSR
eukprot:scaffold82863_cov31-Tisochrysis_lutea.AAC.2